MKSRILLIAALLFCVFTKAQNLNEKKIMGKWNTLSVFIPNKVSQKEAVELIKEAFTGAVFNFKGNKIFKIHFGKNADNRIKEVFFDGENWLIKGNQIKIGTKENGFSSMHITVQKTNGKTYFLLPMMKLEVEKIESDEPSGPKIVKSKSTFSQEINSVNPELIYREIDPENLIPYKLVENPPLAPDCKEKWKIEKKKDCTSQFIRKHVQENFNTGLAAELGIVGKIKIKIEFIIDTNGKPINITADGGPEVMNQNAIDVIATLPEFKPSAKDGKPINVSYKMPLMFYIAE